MPIQLQGQADFEVVRTAWQTLGSCCRLTHGVLEQEHWSHFGTSWWGAQLSQASLEPYQPPGAAGGWAGRRAIEAPQRRGSESSECCVLNRAKQGIFRSMYVSDENGLENQPVLVKLAVTFGGRPVILK